MQKRKFIMITIFIVHLHFDDSFLEQVPVQKTKKQILSQFITASYHRGSYMQKIAAREQAREPGP